MKICHLTKSLDGGAGQYALRLSRSLRSAGVDSVVLAADGRLVDGAVRLLQTGGRLRGMTARGIRSFTRRVSTVPFHTMRGVERYSLPPGLAGADIVHLHGMTGWIGWRALDQLIPRRAAVFQTTHSPFDYSGGCVLLAGNQCDRYQRGCMDCPALKSPWKWVANRELELKARWMRRHGVQAIANSRWMANRIVESPVFQHCTDIPVVPPIISDDYSVHGPAGLRNELETLEGRRLVCLGAKAVTDKGKGIREFVERMAQQRVLAEKVTVVLFGEGEFTVPAGLDVRFLGPVVSPERLAEVFRSSDLFVSPSVMETFGMTLAEAQACGTPVVGFETGGILDAIFPRLHEGFVPVGEWDGLFSKLSAILALGRDEVISKEMSKWVAGRFSSQVVAARQLDIYLGNTRVRPGVNADRVTVGL